MIFFLCSIELDKILFLKGAFGLIVISGSAIVEFEDILCVTNTLFIADNSFLFLRLKVCDDICAFLVLCCEYFLVGEGVPVAEIIFLTLE